MDDRFVYSNNTDIDGNHIRVDFLGSKNKQVNIVQFL